MNSENKVSEIAEKAAHELTTLDRHPAGRGPGCLCADCENARKLIVERAIAESQAWISVEEATAPKDGRDFLAYDDNQNWKGVCWYDMLHKCFLYTGGVLILHFTHWMPLPAPPKGNENV